MKRYTRNRGLDRSSRMINQTYGTVEPERGTPGSIDREWLSFSTLPVVDSGLGFWRHTGEAQRTDVDNRCGSHRMSPFTPGTLKEVLSGATGLEVDDVSTEVSSGTKVERHGIYLKTTLTR